MIRALVACNLRRGPARLAVLPIVLAVALCGLAWLEVTRAQAARACPDITMTLGVMGAFLVAVLAATLAALGASGLGGSRDGLLILEQFPLRHSRVFVADFISALIAALPAVLALAAYPTHADIACIAQGAALPSLYSDLFSSATSVLAWAGTLAWFCLGVTLLARVLAAGDLATLFVTGGLALSVVIPASILLAIFDLDPSFAEITPLLLAAGAVAILGALAHAVHAPAHLTEKRHRDALGGAVLLSLAVLSASVTFTVSLAWKELGAKERLTTSPLSTHPDERPTHTLVAVTSPRSGTHRVVVDLASGRWRDLGRGLEDIAATAAWTGERWQRPGLRPGTLAFGAGRGPRGLLEESDHPLVTIDLAGTHRERSFPTWWSSAGGGTTLVSQVAPVAGGGLILVETLCVPPDAQSCSHTLVVRNPTGAEARFFPLSGVTHELLLSGNRVLAWTRDPGHDNDEREHLLVNLTTFEASSFRLPGTPIAISSDLGRAAVVRSREHAGRRYDSLVLVDLPSLAECEAVGDDVLGSAPVGSEHRLDGSQSQYPLVTGGGTLRIAAREYAGDATLLLDARLEHAVWLEERLSGWYRTFVLHALDLAQGDDRVLVAADRFPRLPAMQSGAAPYLVDLAPDGSAALVWTDGEVLRVNLATGATTLLLRRSVRGRVVVSPGLRRAAAVLDENRKSTRLAFSPTLPSIATTPYEGAARWLDDERLAVADDSGRLVVVRADGSEAPRGIFPGNAPRAR